MTTTTVTGLDELRATLAAAADQLGDLTAPGAEAGQAIAAFGQQYAPVLTGELAGSFGLTTVDQFPTRQGERAVEAIVAELDGLPMAAGELPFELIVRSSTAPPRSARTASGSTSGRH